MGSSPLSSVAQRSENRSHRDLQREAMEKLSSPSALRHHHNGNGVLLKLPPGFRFHPTDEELVVQYLRRKVFSCPLPARIIPEIDLGKYDPWDLPGGGCEQESRYFFALREAKYPNGTRSNRATGRGYWKATGKDRAIVAAAAQPQVVGMKKTLVFYRGKAPNGSRTDWIMHEYRLARSTCVLPLRKNSTHGAAIVAAPRDWVLCRIFMKKRAEEHHEERRAVGFIDFMGRRGGDHRPSSPSASDSSCVTDESSNGEDTTTSTA